MEGNPRAGLDQGAGRHNDHRSKRCGGPVVVCCAPKPQDGQAWGKVWRTNRSQSAFPPANGHTRLLFPCNDRRSRRWESGGTDKNLRDDLRAWVDGSDAKGFVIPREVACRAVALCEGERDPWQTFKVTGRHPEPQRRRGTSQLVALYPNLCVNAIERSLAFARDDSSASVNTWSYRSVSLSFVWWLHALGFRSRRSIASPENLSPRDRKSWRGTEWFARACRRPHKLDSIS